MITFRINIDKNLNNQKRTGILKGAMRKIAEDVSRWLLEHRLPSRALKAPSRRSGALRVSHGAMRRPQEPRPPQVAACQPEERPLKQLCLVLGCCFQIHNKAHLNPY